MACCRRLVRLAASVPCEDDQSYSSELHCLDHYVWRNSDSGSEITSLFTMSYITSFEIHEKRWSIQMNLQIVWNQFYSLEVIDSLLIKCNDISYEKKLCLSPNCKVYENFVHETPAAVQSIRYCQNNDNLKCHHVREDFLTNWWRESKRVTELSQMDQRNRISDLVNKTLDANLEIIPLLRPMKSI